MQTIIVLITAPNFKAGKHISSKLLDKRLIACANIIKNIDSLFWWDGKKERSKEVLIIAKTKKVLFSKLVKMALSIHPYKVPEIIAVPIIKGYDKYLEWVEGEAR